MLLFLRCVYHQLICESTKMLQLLTGEDEVVSVMRKEKLGNCLEWSVEHKAYQQHV